IDPFLGRTNYVGVSGYGGISTGNDTWVGALCNRSKVTLETLTGADGASNTLLFGEYLGDSDTGARQYSASWMGVGAIPTAWGTLTGRSTPAASTDSGPFNFASKHTGVVQFCMADGAVRGVRKGVSGG